MIICKFTSFFNSISVISGERKGDNERLCALEQMTLLKESAGCLVGWLVVLGLTDLLDSILIYIGPSPTEGDRKEKR